MSWDFYMFGCRVVDALGQLMDCVVSLWAWTLLGSRQVGSAEGLQALQAAQHRPVSQRRPSRSFHASRRRPRKKRKTGPEDGWEKAERHPINTVSEELTEALKRTLCLVHWPWLLHVHISCKERAESHKLRSSWQSWHKRAGRAETVEPRCSFGRIVCA
ncbi:unnamed protein product [Durusdinium trenchii]